MTQTQTTQPTAAPAQKKEKVAINGVDVPTVMATLGAVAAQPEIAHFTFRATNRWISGTHSKTTMGPFDGAGGTHEHTTRFELDGDHPRVLVGGDQGPTPVELVLHALASCLMAGVANVASARQVKLDSVTAELTGEIDLNGVFGLNPDVRNGFSKVEVRFDIQGDASPEQLQSILAKSQQRSAVFDIVTNGIPEITIGTKA